MLLCIFLFLLCFIYSLWAMLPEINVSYRTETMRNVSVGLNHRVCSEYTNRNMEFFTPSTTGSAHLVCANRVVHLWTKRCSNSGRKISLWTLNCNVSYSIAIVLWRKMVNTMEMIAEISPLIDDTDEYCWKITFLHLSTLVWQHFIDK